MFLRILLFSLFTGCLLSQTHSFESFQGPYGANPRALTATADGHIFVGTSTAGIFRSTNSGQTWMSASSGLTEKSISSFHLLPGNTLLAGTSMEKVFRSTDHGVQWTELSSLIAQGLNGVTYGSVSGFAAAPNGDLFAASGQNGVFVSTNQGSTWRKISGIATAQFLAVNSLGTIYAVSQSKVYRSFGDSSAWVELPIGASGTISSFGAAQNNSLYAAVSGSLFRSTDHGLQWTKIYSGTTANSIRSVSIMQDGAIMFAVRNTIVRSTDNGVTWSQHILVPNMSTTSFGISDAGSGTIITANNSGGIFRSTNSGSSWILSNNGLNGNQVQRLVITKNGMMVAQMGLRELFYRRPNESEWTILPTHDPSAVVTDLAVTADSMIFIGTTKGVYKSVDLGIQWNAADTITLPYPVADILFDSSAHSLFALTADKGLYRSTDLGTSWTQISSSTAINNAGFLRRSPTGTLFVGANQQVYRSTDGGITWGDLFTVFNASANDIDFTPSGIVYLLAGNTLYRSTDDGISYSDASNGSIFGGTVIRTHGENRLLAGSGNGVMRSVNGGQLWRSFSAGLTNSAVTTLEVMNSGHLLVGTNAGMWKSVSPELNYSFNKDSLSFGTHRIGSVKTDSIILRNRSASSLSVLSVTTADPAFTPLKSSFTISANDSAVIRISFTPSGRKMYASPIIVTLNSGPDTLYLFGAGKAPVLTVGTSQLSFPPLLSGVQSAKMTVMVQNTGDDTLFVSHTEISHPAFSASPDSFILSPGQKLDQHITFAPTTPGEAAGVVHYHSTFLPVSDSVHVQGNGYRQAKPVFHTTALHFGNLRVGTQRSLAVMISNTGNDTAWIERQDTLDEFITYDHSMLFVPPQDTIWDSVTVQPKKFGDYYTTSHYVTLNDSLHHYISVNGRGFELSTPEYSVRKIDAGIVPIGVQYDTVITISNIGVDTLCVINRQLFSHSVPLNYAVLPGDSVRDTITFTPENFGASTISYRYFTNSFETPDTVMITFFGRGTPAMLFTSPGYTFPSVETGKTKQFTVRVYNNGGDTLKVSSSFSSHQKFTTDVKPSFILPYHEGVVDTIRYTAGSAGTDSAYIVYQTNTPAAAETLRVFGVSIGAAYWVMKKSFVDMPLSAFTMALNGAMVAATNKGIFYSTDAGSVWHKGVIEDSVTHISNFVMLPDGMLLASSSRQGLLRSTDNGITWKKILSPMIANNVMSIVRMRDARLLALQQSDDPLIPKIIVSKDNGISWASLSSTLKNPSIYSELFASENFGMLFLTDHTAAELRLLRSLNGITWGPVSTVSNPKVTRVYRDGRRGQTFASILNGGVAMTVNGGMTWKEIYSGGTVTDIYETKDSVLFISVNGQSIKRSENNGTTWTDLPESGNVIMEPFIRHYNGTLWWGNDNGIYASWGNITGRAAVESVPTVIKTGPVELSKSVSIAIPLFNNTADTIKQFMRFITNPRYSFRYSSATILPNAVAIDTLNYTPLSTDSNDMCDILYQMQTGVVKVQVSGYGVPTTGVEQIGTVPHSFTVDQNYPNPFNPATTIGFSIPTAGNVSLQIFNALGQTVATLVDGHFAAGRYSVVWNAPDHSSGVYFYRLRSGNNVQTKRMLLLK